MFRLALAFVAFTLVPGVCRADDTPAKACPSHAGVEFLCGIRNPEDLVHLRGEGRVIASSYLKPDGALFMIDIKTRRSLKIFPSPDVEQDPDLLAFPVCPDTPALFVPLGLDVVRKGPGQYRLFVTNAGDGRRIEVFDLIFRGRLLQKMSWRGCVLSPPTMAVNGVAALHDGSLAVTSTINPTDATSYEQLMAGTPVGSVALWKPGMGWKVIADDEISGPNGIAVSSDGKSIYVAGWGDRTLYHFDIAVGMKLLAKERLDFNPDNLRWGSDGKLYAAGFVGTPEQLGGCIKAGRCGLTSQIVKLHPRTFQFSRIFTMPPIGDDFGAATTGLLVDEHFWIGSFHGDNIVIARAKPR